MMGKTLAILVATSAALATSGAGAEPRTFIIDGGQYTFDLPLKYAFTDRVQIYNHSVAFGYTPAVHHATLIWFNEDGKPLTSELALMNMDAAVPASGKQLSKHVYRLTPNAAERVIVNRLDDGETQTVVDILAPTICRSRTDCALLIEAAGGGDDTFDSTIESLAQQIKAGGFVYPAK